MRLFGVNVVVTTAAGVVVLVVVLVLVLVLVDVVVLVVAVGINEQRTRRSYLRFMSQPQEPRRVPSRERRQQKGVHLRLQKGGRRT